MAPTKNCVNNCMSLFSKCSSTLKSYDFKDKLCQQISMDCSVINENLNQYPVECTENYLQYMPNVATNNKHNLVGLKISNNNEPNEEEMNLHNNNYDLMETGFEVLITPEDLPPKGILISYGIKPYDKVYVNKFSLLKPWIEATIIENIFIESNSVSHFHVKFDDNELFHNFSIKKLAYKAPSNVQYTVGCRVIANYYESNSDKTDNFYAGLVAEPPNQLNNYRYLIFFIDGYAQYTYHKDIRLVCRQPSDVCVGLDEQCRHFIKSYLSKYPDRSMTRFNKKQRVHAEYKGKWYRAKVINIDASLVQLKFKDSKHNHLEWLYRGSTRLEPMYHRQKREHYNVLKTKTFGNGNKRSNQLYIDLEYEVKKESTVNNNHQPIVKEDFGIIETIEIPNDRPIPISFQSHKCNNLCLSHIKYNADQTKSLNILSIPLYYGFKRSIIENKNAKQKIIYTTPCGRLIRNEREMCNYLDATYSSNNHNMTIDMFNFDYLVHPLNVFNVFMYIQFKNDISNGLEFKPISVVNGFDQSMPLDQVEYIIQRKIMPDINLNFDQNFLCGCDCTDNCRDKTKCFCWQQTFDGQKKFPLIFKEITGYKYKRLYSRIETGIFECNTNCKCSKTCLNRVVQQPLSTMLQVFKTKNKGWGVRTLADIPRGTFICIYVGEIYTECDAETIAINKGESGDYLSNLDYIETIEKLKNDHKNFILDVANEDLSSNLDQVETNMEEFDMCLENVKDLQHSNTKIDENYQLSETHIIDKSYIRKYFGKDNGTYVIDSKMYGNVSRYFNHSCNPNMFVQNVFVDTHDLRFPWQAYFASTFIPAGTELVYDYGYEIGSVDGKMLHCYCKSKNCKGRLL